MQAGTARAGSGYSPFRERDSASTLIPFAIQEQVSPVTLVFSLVVVAAGVSVAFQQVLNANLRMGLGSPWWTGFVSYTVGTLVMLAVALALGEPWPGKAMLTNVPWISWSGGLFGAIFIGVSILMIPYLGAATVIALIVVGQMTGSMAFDHFGVLGVPQHDANPGRLLGAGLLIAGAILIRH